MDVVSVGSCLMAGLLYYGTLDAGFVYDDSRAVLSNPDVVGASPAWRLVQHDYWGTPLRHGGSHGSYRPLTVLSFRLSHALAGGARPLHFHLANVLLHAANTALVARLARRLFAGVAAGSRLPAALAAALFAAHPVHSEAVAGVVGRADLAACLLLLLAVLCYAEHVRLRDAASVQTPLPPAPVPCKCVSPRLPRVPSAPPPDPSPPVPQQQQQRRRRQFPQQEDCATTAQNGSAFHRPVAAPDKPRLGECFRPVAPPFPPGKRRGRCRPSVWRAVASFVRRLDALVRSSLLLVLSRPQRCPGCRQPHRLDDVPVSSTPCTGKRIKFRDKCNHHHHHHHHHHNLHPQESQCAAENPARAAPSRDDNMNVTYSAGFADAERKRPPVLVSPVSDPGKVGLLERLCRSASSLVRPDSGSEEPGLGRAPSAWPWLAGSLLLSAAAGLCKEPGFTAPLVCAAYDVALHRRHWRSGRGLRQLLTKRAVRGAAVSVLVLVLWLWLALGLRALVAGLRAPTFAAADNPAARCPSALARALTFLYLPAANAWLLLCPAVLSFDWSMDAVPRVLSLWDARLPAAAALYASLARALAGSWRRAAPPPPAHRRQRPPPPPPPPRLQQVAVAEASAPCPVCRHCTSDQHSAHCRSTNNNNAVAAGGDCCCAPAGKHHRHQPPQQHHSRHHHNNHNHNHSHHNQPQRPRPAQWRAQHATAPEVLLISLAFLVVPFLPATNLLFYVGFVLAERVLYMPSVGWCLLVALGWHLLAERAGRRLAIACAALLLVALSARTLRRNHDWRDEESLYRSGVAVNPPKAYGNLGAVLSSQGRVDEAEQAFRLALQHRPNMADVHYNLGVLLQGRERYEEAMQSLRLAIQYRPTLAVAHLHLAQLLERQGRCAEAEEQYRRCWEADGSRVRDPRAHEAARVQAMLQLGRLRADQGRLHDAVAAFQAAVRHRPPHFAPQALYNLLGETLVRMRHYEQAEQWFRAALQAEPQHVPAHVTYGSLLAMNRSRAAEAERWFRRALQLAPDDPSVHQHFGQFLSGQQRHAEAALRFEAAADLEPSRLDLALAAASSLRVAGLTARAERFYRRAVHLRPQSARHHLNLGAILHLNGRYDEAAACYREALRLQPDDATALTNLQKLRSLVVARRPRRL